MFEMTITKQQLLPMLLTVSGAVDKKQSLPILANVLLRLTDTRLFLTATDLEIEIIGSSPFLRSSGVGCATVPAKKLIDIVRSLDDNASPTFIFDENTLIIKEARSKFKLATLPAEDYPNTDNEVNEVEFSISRLALVHLLQSTHFAMSQNDVRAFLNGLLLELDAQVITAVSTDGHRMAICRLPLATISQHHRFLLPRKGIQEMLRLLTTIVDEEVLLCAGKSHFKLVTTQFTFLTKLIEARFPPYTKAIPRDQDKQVLIDRDQLKRALSRIVILANEKLRAVMLHVQNDQLTLIANNHEQEEAIESLPAETTGSELKIGINASYLLDVLNHVGEGVLRLSLSDTNSSILVESPQDPLYSYIIMPMKI
jgi:DNA polymerase-3 subunit beta